MDRSDIMLAPQVPNTPEGPVPTTEGLSWALRYAALGLPVMPLYGVEDGACACGKPDCSSPGKHPIPRHGLKEASLDAARIERWWVKSPTANLGVRTGGSVIVLDVDGEAGAASIERKVTPRTWTPRPGAGSTSGSSTRGAASGTSPTGSLAWTFGATAGTSSSPRVSMCRVSGTSG